MFSKKIAACLLLCGVTPSCFSMSYVSAAIEASKNGVKTVKEKWDPTGILVTFHAKWKEANPRKKITLLHKLDRAFVSEGGLLQNPQLTDLLHAIEDTAKYPICKITLDEISEHLTKQLPSIKDSPNLHSRTISALYLLSPHKLAVDINSRQFLNTVSDKTEREGIVSNITKLLIAKGDVKEANLLITALATKAEDVPFGTTAQLTLKEFLVSTAQASFKSCEYIDKLGNTKEDEQLKLAALASAAYLKSQQDRLKEVDENQEKDRKYYAQQLSDAQKARQDAQQTCTQQIQEIQKQTQDYKLSIAKESAILEALKARYAQVIAEKESAQELMQEAENSNN